MVLGISPDFKTPDDSDVPYISDKPILVYREDEISGGKGIMYGAEVDNQDCFEMYLHN